MDNQYVQNLMLHLPEIIVVLAVGFLGVPILINIMHKALRRLGVQKTLRHLLAQTTRVAIWLLILLSIMYSVGLTGLAATLTGSVLLIGVALGQAFKDLLTDVISGFAMAKDSDFNYGYLVQIGKDTKGVIKDVGLRKIRLVDEDGHLHVLSNTVVEKSEWIILDRDAKKQLKKEK